MAREEIKTLAEEIVEKTCKAFNTTPKCLSNNSSTENMVFLRTAITYNLFKIGNYTPREISEIMKWGRCSSFYRLKKHEEYIKYNSRYIQFMSNYGKEEPQGKVIKEHSRRFREYSGYSNNKKEELMLKDFMKMLLDEGIVKVEGYTDNNGHYTHTVKLMDYGA